MSVSDGVQIHRLRMTARRRRVPPAVAGAPRADHAALEAPELPADLRDWMQERAEARGG